MKMQSKEENIRLDQYLARELDISRSKIQKDIKEGLVKVNGKKLFTFSFKCVIIYV